MSRGDGRGLATLSASVIGLAFLAPLTWLVFAAFDTRAGLGHVFPERAGWANFAAVATPEGIGFPLLNSAILAVGTAVLTVVVAILAAYPLSRSALRFGPQILTTVLFAGSLPISALIVPVYGLFVWAHLIDSRIAVILFLSATSLPIAVWLTKGFLDRVPIAVEEAAWLDGAGRIEALFRVVLPLMRPGIAVVTITVFLEAWGNFFVPYVLLLSAEHMPAAVAVYGFFGVHGAVDYGLLAAFSLLYALPAVVLAGVVGRAGIAGAGIDDAADER